MLPMVPTNNLLVASGDVYADYFATPVGSYNLVIKRLDEKQEPVAKVPVALQNGMYVTLLATVKDGQVNIQVIDDTPDPKATELTAQLIVRSFFTGGNVTVGVTGGQPAQPVPGGGTVTLDNLPTTAAVNVAVQVTMPTTPPTSKKWDLPADFSVTHHATLLLVSDRSGRLKPQLTYNAHVANPDSERGRERDGR